MRLGTTNYSYDGQDRLERVSYPGTTPSVSYRYNKIHRMLSANSSEADRSFSYDSNGNITSETLSVGGNNFTASYGYNGNDQLSTITYPRTGTHVSYSPDTLGRPTQASGFANSVSYWPSGQIKEIRYANGATSTYGQNSRLWPSSFRTQKGGGASVVDSSYSYDNAGNLTGIGDSADSGYNRSLGYDNINRLTSASGPWGSGSISYDGAGNITRQSLGAWNLTYSYSGNQLNRTSGARNASYDYDAYGNITKAGEATYTYDGAPHLRCIDCARPNAVKTEYTYDGLGYRTSVLKAGAKSYEMYSSNGKLLIEYTPSKNDKLVEYIYLGRNRIAQRVTP